MCYMYYKSADSVFVPQTATVQVRTTLRIGMMRGTPGPSESIVCLYTVCAIYLAEGVFLGRELRPDRT